MEAWRAKYTPEDEKEEQAPREATEGENQRTATDRRAQKRQGGKTAQNGQKRKRRTSQPERRPETRQEGEEDEETDQREKEHYANNEPGELDRLLEDSTDSYKITKARDTPEHTEERRIYDENNDNKEGGMQQENHEPDTLGRIIWESADREEEPDNKANLGSQNISIREEEKEQEEDTKNGIRSRLQQQGGGNDRQPNTSTMPPEG